MHRALSGPWEGREDLPSQEQLLRGRGCAQSSGRCSKEVEGRTDESEGRDRLLGAGGTRAAGTGRRSATEGAEEPGRPPCSGAQQWASLPFLWASAALPELGLLQGHTALSPSCDWLTCTVNHYLLCRLMLNVPCPSSALDEQRRSTWSRAGALRVLPGLGDMTSA